LVWQVHEICFNCKGVHYQTSNLVRIMGRTKHRSLQQVIAKGMEYQTFMIEEMVFRLTSHSNLGGGKGILWIM